MPPKRERPPKKAKERPVLDEWGLEVPSSGGVAAPRVEEVEIGTANVDPHLEPVAVVAEAEMIADPTGPAALEAIDGAASEALSRLGSDVRHTAGDISRAAFWGLQHDEPSPKPTFPEKQALANFIKEHYSNEDLEMLAALYLDGDLNAFRDNDHDKPLALIRREINSVLRYKGYSQKQINEVFTTIVQDITESIVKLHRKESEFDNKTKSRGYHTRDNELRQELVEKLGQYLRDHRPEGTVDTAGTMPEAVSEEGLTIEIRPPTQQEMIERLYDVGNFLADAQDIEGIRSKFGYGTDNISDSDRVALKLITQLKLRLVHLRAAYDDARESKSPEDLEKMEREYTRAREIRDKIFEALDKLKNGEEIDERIIDDVSLEEMSQERPSNNPEAGNLVGSYGDEPDVLSSYRDQYKEASKRLTEDQVMGMPEYEMIARLEQKLAELTSDTKEDSAVREHLLRDTESRLAAAYKSATEKALAERAGFEEAFGSEMADVRDALGDFSTKENEQPQKRTGWWDKNFRDGRKNAEDVPTSPQPEELVEGSEGEQLGESVENDNPEESVVVEDVPDDERFKNGSRPQAIEDIGYTEVEENQEFASHRQETKSDEQYKKVFAQWKEVKKEADDIAAEYQSKLKAHYDSYYKEASLTIRGKEFIGLKPPLTPELRELRDRDESLQEQYAALGGRLVDFRRREINTAESPNKKQDITTRAIARYEQLLEQKLALKPMQERIEMQKKALEAMPQNKTFNAIRDTMRKNKYTLLVGKALVYGGVGLVSGGTVAALAGAGRVGAGFLGGVGGGFAGQRLWQGHVDRADTIKQNLLDKKMRTLSAEELRARRAELIEAYSIKDRRLRQQKIAALAGALIGGGVAASASSFGEQAPDTGDASRPPEVSDVPPEATVAPVLDGRALQEMAATGGVTSEQLDELIPANPESVEPAEELVEPPPAPADVLELARNGGVTTEASPAVNGENLLELERSLGLMPADATVEDMVRTPLDYDSAERIANQEHLFRLGEQYGQNTVSEQVYEAWKDGAFGHLEWVPGPDEISKEEFLDRMNAFIDANSPDAMSADEIRGMDIESGDFHRMPYGDQYDAVPLLDKMFPPEAAGQGSDAVPVVEGAPVESVETPPPMRRLVVSSFTPPEPVDTTVLPPPEAVSAPTPEGSSSMVTPEMIHQPDFQVLVSGIVDSLNAELATVSNVDVAKVSAEISERIPTEFPMGCELSEMESFIRSVVMREHLIDIMAPASAREAFDRFMSENTINETPELLDTLLNQEGTGEQIDPANLVRVLDGIMKLTPVAELDLTLAENIENLFRSGQFELAADLRTLVDAQGTQIARFTN